jgi:hypothetical protein
MKITGNGNDFLLKNTIGPFDPEKMAADHRDNKSIGEIGVYR